MALFRGWCTRAKISGWAGIVTLSAFVLYFSILNDNENPVVSLLYTLLVGIFYAIILYIWAYEVNYLCKGKGRLSKSFANILTIISVMLAFFQTLGTILTITGTGTRTL